MKELLSSHDTSKKQFVFDIETVLKGVSTPDSNYPLLVMNASIADWMRLTHQVMDYAYIGDMNQYVADVQGQEETRILRQRHAVANELLIKKRLYLMRQRDSARLMANVRVMMHCTLFVCLIAYMAFNIDWFGAYSYVAMGCATAAFLTYLVVYHVVNRTRRYDDWDKYYWRAGLAVETPGVVVSPNLLGDKAGECSGTGSLVPFAS